MKTKHGRAMKVSTIKFSVPTNCTYFGNFFTATFLLDGPLLKQIHIFYNLDYLKIGLIQTKSIRNRSITKVTWILKITKM